MASFKTMSLLENANSYQQVGSRPEQSRSIKNIISSKAQKIVATAILSIGVLLGGATQEANAQNVNHQNLPSANEQVVGTRATVVRVSQKTDRQAAAAQRNNDRFVRQIRSSTQRNVSRQVRDATGGGEWGRALAQLAGAVSAETINARRNTQTPKLTELIVEVPGYSHQYVMENPGPYSYYKGQSVILTNQNGYSTAVPENPSERYVVDERKLPRNMRIR